MMRILAPPVFEDDEDKTSAAKLLHVLLLSVLVIVVSIGIAAPFVFVIPMLGSAIASGVALAVLGALYLMRRGRVQLVSALVVCGYWIGYTALVLVSGGVISVFSTGYVSGTVIAALLLGGPAAMGFAGLSMAVSLAVLYVESLGLFSPLTTLITAGSGWVTLAANLLVAAVTLYLSARSLTEALARARLYASESEAQRGRLEDLVAERTRDLARRTDYLAATTAVAHEAASVLGDPQELLSRVVSLISERFGFYHTGLFLLDSSGQWARLRAASSEGGRRMLDRGHRLRVGEQGVVGYVAGRGEHRVALDVGGDAAFLNNPDLPGIRSEVALPLRARGEVIGVLDVQSREPEAFSDEDVSALQSLADQVAVAIDNARLFQQVQESVEAERRAYGELSHEAWRRLVRDQADLGFLSDERDTVPAGDLWRPEMRTALRTGEIALGEDGAPTLAMPIVVRGRVVGVIDGRKRDGADDWTGEEIELLEMLTGQLSIALEGARLYRDAQRLAARELTIGRVTGRMRESLELETMLRTTASEIRRALGLDKIVVRLATPESDAGPA
jgi:GAF domain-containing protein